MITLPFSRLLIASILMAFIGIGSYVLQVEDKTRASMAITPTTATSVEGGQITVDVVVASPIPVNAFAGTLTFDPAQLEVARIDYNNSIADLWAEKPWYENGDGTIAFAGGSTKPGGFTGEGNLITITFRTKQPGASNVEITKAQILKHDGLGSDVPLNEPIDALFTITAEAAPVTVLKEPTAKVVVASAGTPLDLSGDGRISLADVSVLMQYLVTGDRRGDLNGDGAVSLADMSILLDAF